MKLITTRNGIALATGILTALAPTLAFAQTISFTDIANSATTNGGAFGDFSIFANPSINASGTVAFNARLDAGGDGIFTGTGGGTATTIADRTTTNGGALGGFPGTPTINDSGTVVFGAFFDVGGGGLFTSTGGGTATLIANDTTTNGGAFSTFTSYPVINNSGTVAFYANLETGANAIFTSTGGPTATTIADDTTTNGGAFSGFSSFPVINDSGTVAFVADLDAGGSGIFTSTGGGTATLVANTTTTNGGAFDSFGFPGTPAINDSGTVAFAAFFDAGGSGIFTSTGGVLTAIANTTTTNGGAFSEFEGNVAINASGTVVFQSFLDAGEDGIFVALPGGSAPFALVQTGDSLFGSTVTTLSFFSAGLNDSNALVFTYNLADGRTGVAVANIAAVVVPEPGTFALAVLGLLAGVVVRRKK